jgi:hypothetical protein
MNLTKWINVDLIKARGISYLSISGADEKNVLPSGRIYNNVKAG